MGLEQRNELTPQPCPMIVILLTEINKQSFQQARLPQADVEQVRQGTKRST